MAKDEEQKSSTAADKRKEKAPAAEGAKGADGKSEPRKDKDGNVIKDEKDKDKQEGA